MSDATFNVEVALGGVVNVTPAESGHVVPGVGPRGVPGDFVNRWRGVWSALVDYLQGELVFHDGSSWVAVTNPDLAAEPGVSPAWEMVAEVGDAATIDVGTVTELDPDETPTVANSGTTAAAVLDFGLPRAPAVTLESVTELDPDETPTVTDDDAGPDVALSFGLPRAAAVSVGNVSVVTPEVDPTVTNSGTNGDVVLDFQVNRAPTVQLGTVTEVDPTQPPAVSDTVVGPDVVLAFDLPRAADVSIGTVTEVDPIDPPNVTDSGTNGDVVLDFDLPRAATVEIGSVTVVDPSDPPDVTDGGSQGDVSLDFSLPRAVTVTVGTTTGVGSGDPATVTNSGTSDDIVLDFEIPSGVDGAPGADGADAHFIDTWQGEWDSLTAYATGDLVEHDGSTWLATADPSVGQEPGEVGGGSVDPNSPLAYCDPVSTPTDGGFAPLWQGFKPNAGALTIGGVALRFVNNGVSGLVDVQIVTSDYGTVLASGTITYDGGTGWYACELDDTALVLANGTTYTIHVQDGTGGGGSTQNAVRLTSSGNTSESGITTTGSSDPNVHYGGTVPGGPSGGTLSGYRMLFRLLEFTPDDAAWELVAAKGDTGDTGATGATGTAATATAGSTTTGAAGSSASVTNVGTTSAAVFNFTIPRGDTGATGSTGAAGADGKTVRNGSGAPSGGLGVDGDFYIDTAANTIYGPKTAGSWGSPTSLVGPTGATGSTGATGAAGADADEGLNLMLMGG